MSTGLKSFKGIRKGQKFKVTKNIGSHDYPANEILTFRVNGVDAFTMQNIAEGSQHNNIRIDEIELFSETLVEMRKRREEIASFKNSELADLDEKIRTCEELGLEVYDETFVNLHKCLETLDSNATLFEKTLIILSLIKHEE